MLEYSNGNWSHVGNLSIGRDFHAVLTIGPQQLPCLSGGMLQWKVKRFGINRRKETEGCGVGGWCGVKCSIKFYMTLFSALAAAARDSAKLAPASTTPVNQLRCKRDIFFYMT